MQIVVMIDRDELVDLELDEETLAEMVKNEIGGSLTHPESGDIIYFSMGYNDVQVEVTE